MNRFSFSSGFSLLLLVVLWGCDTPPTSFDDVETQTFSAVPGSSLDQKLSEFAGDKSRFTCSITSLNSPGSQNKYKTQSIIHFFPKDVTNRANGKKARWLFVFSSESAPKTDWSYGKHNNVVQVAVCNLPDVEGIEKEMAKRLSQSPGTWLASSRKAAAYQVYSTLLEGGLTAEEPDAGFTSGTCASGFFCSEYFITIVSNGVTGEIYSITVECVEWTYYVVYCGGGGGVPLTPHYPPGGGGGWSPPGGDVADVDDPCYIDPNGPMQLPPPECADPCNWMAPPAGWMCDEPCQTNDSIIDNVSFQNEMHQVWLDSYGPDNDPFDPNQRNEGYFFIRPSNGSYTLDPVPLQNVANPISSCHYLGNFNNYHGAVGVLHTHPYSPNEFVTDQRCLDYLEDIDYWDVSEHGYPWYEQGVSGPDHNIVNALGLPMYVIDTDNIFLLNPGVPVENAIPFGRCGY